MPKVSVVIPNYNHALFLKQRIDSVIEQTFEDIEIIILDDCSTDNSKAIIENYRSHNKVKHIIYNKENSGSTFKQWKKGVELCKAEFIWIAESDDFASRDFLMTLVPKLIMDENLGIAYCQSLSINSENEIVGNWKSHTDELDKLKFESDFRMSGISYVNQFLIHKNTIPNASAVVFRKELYWLAGAETDVKNCGDWITWLKMLLFNDVFYLVKPLNFFRNHENSVIARAVKQFDYSKYVEKYDRTMRKVFQNYLDNKHIEKIDIIKLNHQYIEKEDAAEHFYNRRNGYSEMLE